MSEVLELDLLSNSTRRMKKHIANILKSYSNQWDILAELLQNSIDAIKRWNKEHGGKRRKHFIKIEIDSKNRKIIIEDTGVGFNIERIGDLLAPHGTDKEGYFDEIGEKGVGLTFAMFSSNSFTIESTSVNGFVKGNYSDALSWATIDSRLEIPKFKYQFEEGVHNPLDTFTKIILEDVSSVEEDLELFDWNTDVIEHILRTKTAIGNVKKIFGKDETEIEISLKHIAHTGEIEERPIEYSYQILSEFFDSDDVFDMEKRSKEVLLWNDGDMKRHLTGKIIKIHDTYKSSRELEYFAYFVPGATETFEKIQKRLLGNEGNDEECHYLTEAGIFVSIKGMPTGIRVPAPPTGSAGYWGNIFIMINADYLEFDLGRKSLRTNSVKLFQDIAKSIFKYFNSIRHIISGESPSSIIPQGMGKRKKEEWNALKDLPDLNVSCISYEKTPRKQEAAVVAIFHEMLGAGVIKGYCGLGWSYNAQYDLLAHYRGLVDEIVGSSIREAAMSENNNDSLINDEITIEFKYKAEDVLKDIENGRKSFSEIDIIVCWEVSEEVFSTNGVKIVPIKESDSYFHSANYEIIFNSSYGFGDTKSSKYIISLKEIIHKLRLV